ncbi:hypothetical protein AB0F81_14970 [Actinoplanes sp. NPDC024001]|uniref:hypothetical protein n=1 Tax=Actinoplanes sp. NPDC024001 TaxID=3154598 RepID=UPI00340D1F53
MTRRYPAELIGYDPGTGGEGGQPHRLSAALGANAIFAFAFLLSAVLVGLATVALH